MDPLGGQVDQWRWQLCNVLGGNENSKFLWSFFSLSTGRELKAGLEHSLSPFSPIEKYQFSQLE